MLKALLGKEWKQLRLLRWVAVGLGVGLPPFALIVAEASQSGWLPLTQVTSYSVQGLLTEVAPAGLLALGGLLALLIGSQVFSGDRAAGTETFLLQRPVRRVHVWQSRLLAATSTILIVALTHGACWWFLSRLLLETDPAQWAVPPHRFAAAELIVVFAGLLASLLAAAIARTPMQAVLLGLVLIALPVGLGALTVGLFPMASYRGVPVGAVLAPLLFVGYAVSAYAMVCRGEPAGRGRWLRGTVSLGVASVALVVLFVTAAPASLRLDAGRFHTGGSIYARSQGDRAFVMTFADSRSGWLWDLEAGRRLEFIPGVSWSLWNADGSRLAVIHHGDDFGGLSAQPRIVVLDADGEHVWDREADPDIAFFADARWAGSYFVVHAFLTPEAPTSDDYPRSRSGNARSRTDVLLVASLQADDVQRIELNRAWSAMRLLGPAEDGEVYAVAIEAGRQPTFRISLHRLDAEGLRLHPVEDWTAVTEDKNISGYGFSLSPSGEHVHDMGSKLMFDRGSDEPAPVDGHGNRWLANGEMVWRDHFEGRQIRIGPPGTPRTTLDLQTNESTSMEVSPDRRRVLVSGRMKPDPQAKHRDLRELWLYDSRDDSWTDLMPHLDAAALRPGLWVRWVGSDRLGFTAPGLVAVQELAPGSPLRWLVDPR